MTHYTVLFRPLKWRQKTKTEFSWYRFLEIRICQFLPIFDAYLDVVLAALYAERQRTGKWEFAWLISWSMFVTVWRQAGKGGTEHAHSGILARYWWQLITAWLLLHWRIAGLVVLLCINRVTYCLTSSQRDPTRIDSYTSHHIRTLTTFFRPWLHSNKTFLQHFFLILHATLLYIVVKTCYIVKFKYIFLVSRRHHWRAAVCEWSVSLSSRSLWADLPSYVLLSYCTYRWSHCKTDWCLWQNQEWHAMVTRFCIQWRDDIIVMIVSCFQCFVTIDARSSASSSSSSSSLILKELQYGTGITSLSANVSLNIIRSCSVYSSFGIW